MARLPSTETEAQPIVDPMRPRFGVGSSCMSSRESGREAVRSALCGRRAAPGDLVVLFASADADEVAELHAGAVEEAGDAQVVGCTGDGVFTQDAMVPQGCAAAYLPAEDACFGVAYAEPEDEDLVGAARRAAELARRRAGAGFEHSVLMVLTPGRIGDQREVVRGAYQVTGARVPIVGCAAGTGPQLLDTHLFVEGRTLPRAVVAVWINSRRPLGVGVRHGWRPLGRPLLVTRAEGNMIYELDGRPALEVYLAERCAEIEIDREALSGKLMDRPLGLPNSSGRYDVRHILGEQDGGMRMFGYVPEQSVVQVMAGDASQLLGGARQAAVEAAAQLERAPRGSLVFSCAARVPVLGDRLGEEAREIFRALHGAPLCGLFTFGEFARVTGSTGFHNATVSILSL